MKTILSTLVAFLALLSSPAYAATADTDLLLQKEEISSGSVSVSIHIQNPSRQEIKSVQSWLQFDPQILKGIKIDASTSPFDFVAPGENNFDASKGIVKIGRSTISSGISAEDILVATVSFERLSTETTQISFYNFQVGSDSNTSVRVFEDGFPVNVLKTEPQAFTVGTGDVSEASTSTSTKTASIPVVNQAASTSVNATISQNNSSNLLIPEFILSRPVKPRITSGPEYAVLAWAPVTDAKGYNVYYSNRSGRYLQRRGAGNVTEYSLDKLQTGEVYYFAITAYDASNQESDYSDEVRVRIGYPESSSAPLLFTKSQEFLKKAKRNVESGPTQVLFIVTLLSVISSFLFVKRQKI